MMVTLVLAADDRDASRARSRLPVDTEDWAWLADAGPTLAELQQRLSDLDHPESVCVIRTDRWTYSERTISALRLLATLATVIDPSGLLGVESAGIPPEVMAKRRHTQSLPVGLKLGTSDRTTPSTRTPAAKRQPSSRIREPKHWG